MTRGRRDQSELASERGASLVIALAMVMMIGVAMVAALGFATAGVRSVTAVGTQRGVAYSADAGVATAIEALRSSATAGTTAVGTACPAVSYAAVGAQPAVAVTCQVVKPRSTAIAGTNMPPYSIWAVGSSSAEPGIVASPSLAVNGPIASNSPANGTGATDSIEAQTTIDASGYTVDATGTCSGTVTVSKPADKHCSSGFGYPDPGYPSQTLPALTAPNPNPTCTVTNGVLQFAPGYYTDTAEFETPVYLQGGNTCKTGYLYFKPGVYYFDYGFDPAFTDQTWTVSSNQFIVGGEYKNWNPNTANSVPAAPGGGAAVACKTDADGAISGVQFVFGGASHWKIQNAGKVELCPDPAPTGTSQQIAIYGETAGAAPAALTATQVPATAANPGSWASLANVVSTGAPTIDGLVATRALTSSQSTTLVPSGFPGAGAIVPAGSINVTYTLKVAHVETNASTGAVATLTATAGACAVSTLTPKITAGIATDSFVLSGTTCINSLQNAFNVSFTSAAASAKSFTENLDGIELLITYTPPAPHPQSGCVSIVNGTCDFLNFGLSGPHIVVWGTVYAPAASVFVDEEAGALIEFRRGVVARTVQITNVPAGDSTGDFCLGGGSPCAGPERDLMFTATVAGVARVRALVRYRDAPSLGLASQILSWNVLR